MFFAKEKDVLVSLEKLSTFVNSFTVCKFCNNPVQVEEDNNKLVGLACFLKIVCPNAKCLMSKTNSSVNISNKNGQFFEINRLFVLACRLIGRGHSADKKLTSVLNMTQPISKVSWKRHTKTITDATVNVTNNSMKKAALDVKKYLVSNTSYTPTDDLLEEVTEVSVSVDASWGSRRFSSRQGIVDICSEETGKVIDVILTTNYCKTCSNIKTQKDAGSINLLEYLEKSAKHKPECLLNHEFLKNQYILSALSFIYEKLHINGQT